MCRYKKISYGLELFFSGQRVTLNRFYTEWDLEGIREMVNVGHEKMIIIGDEKFLIQSYAINREVLLGVGKYQPYTVFPFINGYDLAPIPALSRQLDTILIAVQQTSLTLIHLHQLAP